MRLRRAKQPATGAARFVRRWSRRLRWVRRALLLASLAASVNTALKRRQQGGTDFGPSGGGGAGVPAPTGGPTPQPPLAMAAAAPAAAVATDATTTTVASATSAATAEHATASTSAEPEVATTTSPDAAGTPSVAPAAATDPATAFPAAPPAAWIAAEGATPPAGYPVKANLDSGIFHVPGGLSYERTHADRWYRTPEAARADGLRQAKR